MPGAVGAGALTLKAVDATVVKSKEAVVHPLSNRRRDPSTSVLTGIDPRHRLHHLSLLPSGPDEVRDRLLRGGRSI